MHKLLVVQVAGLGHDFMERMNPACVIEGLRFRPIQSIFPSVTCSVQATMRTGSLPAQHGMVGNGFYSRELQRPFFWEQSSSLVQGDRLWKRFRDNGRTVGQLFWQQSLGIDSDVILSPAPIHKHHGGMIQDVYCRPRGLYDRLCTHIGRCFNLAHYWGPRASYRSSQWITKATEAVMSNPAPDLLLTYIPHLDYNLQQYGPRSSEALEAYEHLRRFLERLIQASRQSGYHILIFGDYAITHANQPIFPNRLLRDEGLFTPRKVHGMTYANIPASRAFATVDHQICHVVTRDPEAYARSRDLFVSHDDISDVMGPEKQQEWSINHRRSGDLVLTAAPGAWFAYPWWHDDEKEPDYASHVDIHNKPGYDPCELLWGFWPFSVSRDATKIKGTHGAVRGGTETMWTTDITWDQTPDDILGLSQATGQILTEL